jgi:hypothetical protein
LRFVPAGALLASGATDGGVAELRSLITKRPTWELIVRGFADKGLIGPLPGRLSIDTLFNGP